MKGGFPGHGGNLGWAAERYGRDPDSFLDFSANVNPLGPSPLALEAAREALADISRYPEPDASSLRGELASFLGIEPGLLVLGNGSTEIIHHLTRCLEPPVVTVVSPAFAEYEAAASNVGAEMRYLDLYPDEGFYLKAEELAEAASGSQLTYFCNPASPTGRLYQRHELLPAVEACRKAGGLLVLDESFMGFCPEVEARRASLMPEVGGGGLAILSTLTKFFALAGLRGPGWLAGPGELVSILEKKAVPWRVNAISLAAARSSLSDIGYIEETRRKVAEWRKELAVGLENTGIFRVFPSQAVFILLQVTRPELDAAWLVDEMGKRGVLLRLCSNFRGLENGFIRVAVRTPADNDRLLETLEDISRTQL
jgi:threonine-phosphate decarboxylase